MSPARVGISVWIAGDIAHWQGMTKITDGYDYCYCIIVVHCLPPA